MSRVSTPSLTSEGSSSPPISPFLTRIRLPSGPAKTYQLKETFGSVDWLERREGLYELVLDHLQDIDRRKTFYEARRERRRDMSDLSREDVEKINKEDLGDWDLRDRYFLDRMMAMLNEVSPALVGNLKRSAVAELLESAVSVSSKTGEQSNGTNEAAAPAVPRKRGASTAWEASIWTPLEERVLRKKSRVEDETSTDSGSSV